MKAFEKIKFEAFHYIFLYYKVSSEKVLRDFNHFKTKGNYQGIL